MTTERFLSKKLQQFSILDIGLIKCVYLLLGLLIFSLYPKLSTLDWWFYLPLAILCSIPLWVHFFSQKGSLLKKMQAYLKTNSPSNQMLLAMAMFFFALTFGLLLPTLVSFHWWIYLGAMIILAIKPLTVSWFW
jgi:hypothetical protein